MRKSIRAASFFDLLVLRGQTLDLLKVPTSTDVSRLMWHLRLKIVPARLIGVVKDHIAILQRPSSALTVYRTFVETFHLPLIH